MSDDFFTRPAKTRPVNPFDPDSVASFERSPPKPRNRPSEPRRTRYKPRPESPFLERWEMAAPGNVISLPRVAVIQGQKLGRNEYFGRVRDAWGCRPVNDHGAGHYADFAFPAGWHLRRGEFVHQPAELVDAMGDVRAEIVGPEEIFGDPMLVLMPRYYVSTGYALDDSIRVVAIDRRSNRVLRQTEWVSPNELEYIERQIRVYEAWLNVLKPRHRDPLSYWGEL
jgi:hypothetical protein